MKIAHLAVPMLSAALIASPAFADAIPYPNPGVVAATHVIYSDSYGITVYFDGSSAGYDNEVSVIDVNTGYNSGEFFPGHETVVGTTLTLGAGGGINPGDTLIFDIESGNGSTYSSDPLDSADGVNHAYLTSFTGTGGIPSGIYVGFEDSPIPGGDADYNDDSFVYTGVVIDVPPPPVSATPEPGSLALLGTGLLSAFGVARRRFNR